MKRCLAVLCIGLVIAGPVLGQGTQRFESYSLGAADAAAIETVVKNIVGGEGTVVFDGKANRLLVVTTDEKHTQIGDMMKQVATPPQNVKIDVSFRSLGSSDASEASVSGDGAIVFENGVTRSRVKITPKLESRSDRWTGNVNQMLLVASGREAFLNVGESVPHLEWLLAYGMSSGVIAQQVGWQNAGARLVVEPTVLGDGMIRVRITPELSGFVDGKPLHTRFATVATEVFVRDGETISLGGLAQNKDFYSRFLIGTADGRSGQSLDISLTPRIMTSPAAP